mgnify:CR=1 FL=1
MKELTIIFSNELGKLINDYYRHDDLEMKKQIQRDIQLLNEAIVLYDQSYKES